MKIIIVPDDGQEYALVPKVATAEIERVYENRDDIYRSAQAMHDAMLAAAPPCKVVELPAAPVHLGHNEVKIWYACLDEIERRAIRETRTPLTNTKDELQK